MDVDATILILGVDNFTLGTDGQKDAGHEHYIESGPHMMLMPKDPSSLDGLSTEIYTTIATLTWTVVRLMIL